MINSYPRAKDGPPRHRLFAIEYFNPDRKARAQGTFFQEAGREGPRARRRRRSAMGESKPRFVPEQEILARRRDRPAASLGLSLLSRAVQRSPVARPGAELPAHRRRQDERVRHALATNLSDLLRYQNMLCRYDTMALKSLDIFSVHGFPVGLVQCESNLLGIINGNGAQRRLRRLDQHHREIRQGEALLRRAVRGAPCRHAQGPRADQGRVDRRAAATAPSAQRAISLRQLD